MSDLPLINDAVNRSPRLSENVFQLPSDRSHDPVHCEIGVLKGEGVGTEIIEASLTVLSAIQSVSEATFSIQFGGCIGVEAMAKTGKPLSDEVRLFCQTIFDRGGAVLSGPGGGRYVYDLRKHFNLFCKLNPLVPHPELRHAGCMKSECIDGVDLIVVRENVGGIYQGEWTEECSSDTGMFAAHRFSYSQNDVARIIEVAAQLASSRRGKLAVVIKANGIPTVSKLWLACGQELARQYGVEMVPLDVDYAAYRLIQDAAELDVVVTPNLFGDILSDLGGVLLGSRGMCFSGSFSASGHAVYQTNHGAAHDLTGSDRANPVAQILSLAMMLRESFGLTSESGLIERAVRQLWSEGFRTEDLREPHCRIIGTSEVGKRVAENVSKLGRLAVKN